MFGSNIVTAGSAGVCPKVVTAWSAGVLTQGWSQSGVLVF